MEIKIEKPHQNAPILIELATEPGKKPLELVLRPDQAQGLIDIVQTALRADKFAFRLEI